MRDRKAGNYGCSLPTVMGLSLMRMTRSAITGSPSSLPVGVCTYEKERERVKQCGYNKNVLYVSK